MQKNDLRSIAIHPKHIWDHSGVSLHGVTALEVLNDVKFKDEGSTATSALRKSITGKAYWEAMALVLVLLGHAQL